MQGQLFDDTDTRRDATFVGRYRIKLSRDWGEGQRALVIGCNPSTADALRDDPTSRWWNAWFKHAGFSGYDAANLYPFCTSNPAECREIVTTNAVETRRALQDINLPALVDLAKAAQKVFVCWGAIAWDSAWIDHVCEKLRSARPDDPFLWCWGTTMHGAPKHPLARGKHRISSNQSAIAWG
jgi:hypothetical protein